MCVETGIREALSWGRLDNWAVRQLHRLRVALPDMLHTAPRRCRNARDHMAALLQQAQQVGASFLHHRQLQWQPAEQLQVE